VTSQEIRNVTNAAFFGSRVINIWGYVFCITTSEVVLINHGVKETAYAVTKKTTFGDKKNMRSLASAARIELRRLSTNLLLVTCVALAMIASVSAQGTRGTIRGTVTDPNGAIVPGATVKLIDVARNQEIRSVETDQNGSYQFLEVDPATYNIVITATGFAEIGRASCRERV